MAAPINVTAYSDALVVLGTAGIVVPLVRRWGLNPVLGYLIAGAVLGPLGLGAFSREIPPLYWVTVTDAGNVAGIAEFGIVFLLFLVGLELSFARLMTLRRMVFGLGFSQVLISTLVIGAVAHKAGLDAAPAIVVGGCLALSSTAIVIELFSARGKITSHAGRASFAVLLAQDLAVVPLLFMISVLGTKEGSLAAGLASALLQTGIALAGIVLFGRIALRPILRLVASTRSDELFIAAILFVIVGTGLAAALSGVSMALGAFVAGLMLAETEYRKAVETIVNPFKGLLLGMFFFTIGMGIDFRELMREPVFILAAVLGLVVLKGALLFGLARLFGVSRLAATETAMLLGPAGEFAFVGIGAALGLGLIPPEAASFVLAVTALSMALIPVLDGAFQRFQARMSAGRPVDPALLAKPDAQQGHAIVVGYGRVGKVVCALLTRHKLAHLATDLDPTTVAADRRAGHPVYYGNAADPAFLAHCGLGEASAVIITVHTRSVTDKVVTLVRAARPDLPIIARAMDAAHARHLYQIGVTEAVPETIEASLQLSEAALVNLRVPMGKIIASIHEKRDEFRDELREAAGREATYAIKSKTTG